MSVTSCNLCMSVMIILTTFLSFLANLRFIIICDILKFEIFFIRSALNILLIPNFFSVCGMDLHFWIQVIILFAGDPTGCHLVSVK